MGLKLFYLIVIYMQLIKNGFNINKIIELKDKFKNSFYQEDDNLFK